MMFLLLFTELSDDKPCPTQHLKRSGHEDGRWKNLPLMTLKKIVLIFV